VRELERRRSLVAEEDLHPCDEVVEIRDLGEDVVADDQARLAAFRNEPLRSRASEELDKRGTPRSSAAVATLAAGSIPRIGASVPRKCCSR
jgi:hypothetical protein